MYRVVELYGDFEPWWFLEDWEDDIVNSQYFEDYYKALKYYRSLLIHLSQEFPKYKSRSDLMGIFWDSKDKRWCEECDEFLQQYHSIALLDENQVIPQEMFRPGYSKENDQESNHQCHRKEG